MAMNIILKKSSVAGKIPDTTDLQVGEPAFNLVDKKLFTKDGNDNIIEIGSGKMVWRGKWQAGTYEKDDVVRDDKWTMIANKTTSDRPSPQPSGVTKRDTENVSFSTVTHDATIRVVHYYTIAYHGWIENIYIKTPTVDDNITSKIIITNTTNADKIVINNPELVSEIWNEIYVGFYKINENDIFKIEYEFTKSNSGSPEFSGDWTVDESTAAPGGAVANFDDLSSPTSARFSHTDWNGDLQTELESVGIDDVLYITDKNNIENFIEASVSSTTHNQNDVAFGLTVLNSSGTITPNSRILVDFRQDSAPVSYYEKTGYRPSNNPDWASVTSDLFYNNVNQNVTDSAFGIDISFQKAIISDDWELVAYSSDTSSKDIVLKDIVGESFFNLTAGDDSVQLLHNGREDTLKVYRNGLRLIHGHDYTYANTTSIITFNESFENTDVITVDYKYE